MIAAELPLEGAGGEPVDLWRTFMSHGFVDLPPLRLDAATRTLEVVLPVDRRAPRRVVIDTAGRLDVLGPRAGKRETQALVAGALHVLRLDEDLSGFYAQAELDPALAWAADGAGRMLRSPTAFEDVVKTICTTNCAWSATVRMVSALVAELGEQTADGHGRAFPTAAAMAAAPLDFYRDRVRAGYRGPYVRALAAAVADGSLDLEELADARFSDEEVESRLLALPGVGPYAAAHAMMLLGRYSRLVLDSWTRPKYARLVGRKQTTDRAIERRFRPYGRFAGLAFWLFLTRDWVEGEIV